MRARIGVVFQQYNLFPHLTVLDNVTLAARHVHGTPASKADAAAIETAGPGRPRRQGAASTPTGSPAGSSSGSRSCGPSPPTPELLLLDEITSALDPELVGEVLELVRALADDGTTIVMATHEMAFARDVADRVVFLDGGRDRGGGHPAAGVRGAREERTRAFLARFTS